MISRVVVIVDSDQGRAKGLAGLLKFGHYEPHIRTPVDFLHEYDKLGTLSAVLVGEIASPDLNCLLETRRCDFPEVPLVTFLPTNRCLLGEHASWEIAYPLEPNQFSDCMRSHRASTHNRRERVNPPSPYGELRQKIDVIASRVLPAIIYGESSRGRSLVGHAIHKQSKFGDGPYLTLSGHTEASVLRKEMLGFSHTKGALELCDGGTLFLDNIAWVDETCQMALLGVITHHHVQRIDSPYKRPTSVRLLVGCEKDLKPQVEIGEFRSDLWHRLILSSLTLPCLHKRFTDLPELLQRLTKEHPLLGLQTDDLESMLTTIAAYGWPEDIMQLARIVEWLNLVSLDESWASPCAKAKDLASFLACLELVPADLTYRKADNGIKLVRQSLREISTCLRQ